MNMLGRWLRNLGERLRGYYYEGPEPPERLTNLALEFANTHPNATREEWVEFAARHGRECYRSGYTRGIEWAERDLERRDPALDPEKLAEIEGHEWRWGYTGNLYDKDTTPPDGAEESRVVQQELEHFSTYMEERAGHGKRR